ncbi:eae-like domain protein [Enterobacter soli]|uniref:eae-like domain protein n=1 Tax=Enterobacter soli TaxID=885040 RepID=UPI0021475F5C|nr:eae-like domain protein [Enterobacter soli]MCR1319989.1 eae-like domain protein [Enterobacter soli]
MTDSLNNKELVAVGHELAKALSTDTPIIDIAKILTRLAERLDCTTAALREKGKQCDALAEENAGLKAFKANIYQQMGAGCEAPEFAITEGISNLRRFSDTLHAIEREFFTEEVPDEEYEGETAQECPFAWGMSVEQYVAEFGKCLAEVRAQGADECVRQLVISDADDDFSDAPNVCAMVAHQLRKGVQS